MREAKSRTEITVANAHGLYMAAMKRGDRKKLKPETIRNELFGAPSHEIERRLDAPRGAIEERRSQRCRARTLGAKAWQTNHAWLFPSPRIDGPQLYDWFKARDRVHERMEEYAGASLARWHFHDLRRTFRSNARRLGIDREIAELMLNHKRKRIEDIYNKSRELEPRATGFAAWEAFLTRIAVANGNWLSPRAWRLDRTSLRAIRYTCTTYI